MTDSFVRIPETLNNNLHIWELAEMLKEAGKIGLGDYKVLTPKAISDAVAEKDRYGQPIETPYGATEEIDNANVIAALNGPMAHIYLKGYANGKYDWKNNPSIDDTVALADVLMKFLVDGGSSLDEDVAAGFKRLLSSVDKVLIRVENEYYLYKSENPMGIEYVKADKRITGLNDLKRSGDIVLIFKDKTPDDVMNRYTSGVACKSWHGSLNPSDSYVPLIISYPGGSNGLLKFLTDKYPGNTCDGNWQATEIIKEIIKKQYE